MDAPIEGLCHATIYVAKRTLGEAGVGPDAKTPVTRFPVLRVGSSDGLAAPQPETLDTSHELSLEPMESARGLSTAVGFRPKLSEVRGFAFTASILFALSVSHVTAQTRLGQIIYTTQTICEHSKLFSLEECKNAFLNANAELDEKAPRFSKRSECERYFRHCMIGDVGGDPFRGKAKPRVSFMPVLRAILISGRSGADRRVSPRIEGGEGDSLFESRSISEVNTMESGEKTRRAQAEWERRQTAAPAAANIANPVSAPREADVEPKGLDGGCAALVNAFAYNACLARAGPRSKP
jgi:uncharacterized protein YgiB involved in biofilm formation